MTNTTTMIIASTIDMDYKYMDFTIDDVCYRYEAKTGKFTKLFGCHCDTPYGKTIRGKFRAVVLEAVKGMYESGLKVGCVVC